MQNALNFSSSQKPMDLSGFSRSPVSDRHVSRVALLCERVQNSFSVKEMVFSLGSVPFPEEKIILAKKMLEGVSSSLDEEIIGEDFF